MISGLVKFGRRQLHTIVSTETIKPSTPTDFHLKTYNLSVLDQVTTHSYMPIVLFYPNTENNCISYSEKIRNLKNSLAQTLTKYYPFVGRHAKTAPTVVHCNDDGAELIEASVDTTLDDFLQTSQHKDLDQFFPYRLIWYESDDLQSETVVPLAVQVNHFECGGLALAVSLSHKIADGSSLLHFVNDWAKMTRVCSEKQKHEYFPINPKFLSFQHTNINFSGYSSVISDDCVTRSFTFPNIKINSLKLKVANITNPTRVEVLTCLLYKCVVAAAMKSNNWASFKPTGVGLYTNLRDKMLKTRTLPENSIGNIFTMMLVETNNINEIQPEFIIGEFKKQKKELRSLNDIETVCGDILNTFSKDDLEERQRKLDESYSCTSICGFPAYGIDFGWGKPIKVTLAGNIGNNIFTLMDTSNRDGIEALVCLRKQEMEILENDPELLAIC